MKKIKMCGYRLFKFVNSDGLVWYYQARNEMDGTFKNVGVAAPREQLGGMRWKMYQI